MLKLSKSLRLAQRTQRCTMFPTLRRLSKTPTHKVLRVLGIESSADDACAAVVTSSRQILSSVVYKQHDINVKYGGIHPIKAQDAHARDMPVAVVEALQKANLTMSDIDAVAYTRGPGMYGCLSIGATTGKAVAAVSSKPCWGIHHMQAHTLTPFLTEPTPPTYPFLSLLVSGGHTMLVLVKSQDNFRIITTKLDNSVGDSFDKIARLLKLPPSPTHGLGSQLERYASLPPLPPFDTDPLPPLKLPLSTNKSVNQLSFSFAGLMSSAEKVTQSRFRNLKMKIPEPLQREISRIYQAAAVGHMVKKVEKAIKVLHERDGISEDAWGGLVVSGGVASNQYLRQELRAMLDRQNGGKGMPLFFPPIELCTDNAAMIAWTAVMRIQAEGDAGDPYSLPLRAKWSLEDLYDDLPQST